MPDLMVTLSDRDLQEMIRLADQAGTTPTKMAYRFIKQHIGFWAESADPIWQQGSGRGTDWQTMYVLTEIAEVLYRTGQLVQMVQKEGERIEGLLLDVHKILREGQKEKNHDESYSCVSDG